ncbi:hypothetical protein S1OALGB6SA_1572 [Olavius algarvensis spirochete endosymbiont]|uniref:hypothetical protein n=1 Tax=Olavius algarvensis spirochete endosymbiont TaxID=260710 RepID=UPI000F1E1A91|nr:hypothetical protein [Olavius algarvensis spirochete endosymbiont]CAD7838000.1 MAG: hypothetical protein [Olavius algarvensis spirochete endosymbiont]VDB00490.1 hypothetical protein S1OALGB6SA_1572 [Olavius algarvensis spirochete endosymbiont]
MIGKKTFSCILLVLLCSARVMSFTISVVLTKKSFSLDECIEIKVEVKNDSNEYSLIPLVFIPEDYYIRFEITDLTGGKAKFIGMEHDYIQSDIDLVNMPSMSTFSVPLKLSDYYKVDEGDFKLQAIYEIREGVYDNSKAWFGEISSDIVEFCVHK